MSQEERNVEVIKNSMAKYTMETRRERAPDRNNKNRGKRSRGTVDSDLRHKPGPVGGQNSKPLHKQRNRKRHGQKTETDFMNDDDKSEPKSFEKAKETYDSKHSDQKRRHKSHELKEPNDPKMKANHGEKSNIASSDRSTTKETTVTEAKDDIRRLKVTKQNDTEVHIDSDERDTDKLQTENKSTQEIKKPSSGKRWKPIMVRRKKDTPAMWSENVPADSWEEECKKANDHVRMNEAIKEAVKPAKNMERLNDADEKIIKDKKQREAVNNENSAEEVMEKNKAAVEKSKSSEGRQKKEDVEKNYKDEAVKSSGHKNKSKAARSPIGKIAAAKGSDDGKQDVAEIICYDKIKHQGSFKPANEKRQINKRKESKKCVTKAAKENEARNVKDVEDKENINKKKKKEQNNAKIHEVLNHDGQKPLDQHAKKKLASHKKSKQSSNIKNCSVPDANWSKNKCQTEKKNKDKLHAHSFKGVKGTRETVNERKKSTDKGQKPGTTTTTAVKAGVSILDGRVSKQKPNGSVTVPATSNTSVNQPLSQNRGRVSRKAQEARLVKSRTQSAAQDVRQSIKVQSLPSVSKHSSRSVSQIGDGRATDTSTKDRSVMSKSNSTENKNGASRTSNTSAKTSLLYRRKDSKSSALVGQKRGLSKSCSATSSKSLSRIPIPSRSPSVRPATPSVMRLTSGKSNISASNSRSLTKSTRKMTPEKASIAKSSSLSSKASAEYTPRSTRSERGSSTKRQSAIPVPVRSTSKASIVSVNQKRFACSSRPVSASTVSTMSPVNRSISSRASSIRTCISRASTRATSSALSSYREEFEYESVASSTPESLRKSWKK